MLSKSSQASSYRVCIIVIIIIPPSILLHCEHAAQSIQLCTLGDWHLLLQITCKTYRKYVIQLLSKAVFCFANISTNASILKREHLPFWNSHQSLHLHWQFEHAKMYFLCSQKTGIKANANISASKVLAICFCIFLAVIV